MLKWEEGCGSQCNKYIIFMQEKAMLNKIFNSQRWYIGSNGMLDFILKPIEIECK